MKILIGSIMKTYQKSIIALVIRGVGLLESSIDKENTPFRVVQLNKKKMIKLRDYLNEEIVKDLK